MKGLFIPEITTEMFRDGCLESIEQLMAEGEIYDIEYSKWIPVSENLPKYNKTVLVSVKQKGKEAMVFTAQRRRRVKTPDIFECCTDYDGWWDFRIAAWDDHEVIAWMPLPEPYKAESFEEDCN